MGTHPPKWIREISSAQVSPELKSSPPPHPHQVLKDISVGIFKREIVQLDVDNGLVQILAPFITLGCVTSSKLFSISVPQFPHL